jgi:hypothetical protein
MGCTSIDKVGRSYGTTRVASVSADAASAFLLRRSTK